MPGSGQNPRLELQKCSGPRCVPLQIGANALVSDCDAVSPILPAGTRPELIIGRQGKGWLSVGRMSLKKLRFLDSRITPLATLPTESSIISMRRAPSAYPAAAQRPPLPKLLQRDNHMP